LRVVVHPVKGFLSGVVAAPPSKSYTHRALFAALLANGESRVVNPLLSGDTAATVEAVRRFGGSADVRLTRAGVEVRVTGVGGVPRSPPCVYCRGSGTTLRIATAVASLSKGPTLLYGNESLNRRPVAPLLNALGALGARTLSRNGEPPVAVAGPIKGGEVAVDASISSQFVTALLTVAPVIGLKVRVVGKLKSAPYVDVTLKVLEAFGARHSRASNGKVFEVDDGGYMPTRYEVPGDYSSAAFIMAAAALAGEVVVKGVSLSDPQGDKAVLGFLQAMGAEVRINGSAVVIASTGVLKGVTVDCSNTPDLVPVLAALAPHAKGVTKVVGAEHLAFKETNRLATLTRNLRALGVKAYPTEDGIVVSGGRVRGGSVNSFGDHRVAMAMAVTALRAEAPVVIDGAECVTDSYPSFFDDLRSLGVKVEVIKE